MGWPMLAGAGLQMVGGLLSGGGQPDPQNAADVHLANIQQQKLYDALAGNIAAGAGDFGMGAATKTGKTTLQQFMADRGINPAGGAGLAGYSQMLGTAGAQANQNRLNYAMNLLRSPLQTVQTAGANWLPGSPSFGYGPQEQWKHFVAGRHRNFGGWGGDQYATHEDWAKNRRA